MYSFIAQRPLSECFLKASDYKLEYLGTKAQPQHQHYIIGASMSLGMAEVEITHLVLVNEQTIWKKLFSNYNLGNL